MPSGVLVSDLIPSALRRAGVIASGEVPTSDETNDSLYVLNDILENLSTERLSVWRASNLSFSTTGGQSTYTIGAGGNFNAPRPIAITDAYCNFGGVDFPIDIIDQHKYNIIPIKNQQQQIVERLLYVPTFPLGTITMYPVPSQAIPVTLTCASPLLTPSVILTDTLTGPPGFAKMIRLVLALELCGEFQVPPDATLPGLASDAKGDYRRTNLGMMTSSFDDALVGAGYALWQRGY